MRKFLVILGSVIAVIGAVGLLLTGDSLVYVMEVLTFNQRQEPLPVALTQIRTTAFSMTALTLGLGFVSLGTVCFSRMLEQSTMTRACFGASALAFLIGTAPLLLSMVNAISGFQQIAASTVAPTVANVTTLIESLQPRYDMGFLIFMVAASLLLLGTLFLKTPLSPTRQTSSSIPFVICVTIVLLQLPILFAVLRLDTHAGELIALLSDTAGVAKPAELARYFSSVLFMPFLVVVGVAVQGMILLIISVSSSNLDTSTTADTEAPV